MARTATAEELVVRVHPDVVEEHTAEATVIDLREHRDLPEGVEIRHDGESGYAIVVDGQTICHALSAGMARRIGAHLATSTISEPVGEEPQDTASGDDRRRVSRDLLSPPLKVALDELWERTRVG